MGKVWSLCKGTNLQVTLQYKGPLPPKKTSQPTVTHFHLSVSVLAVEEFLRILTGLEHSEMMDLVPSNIAYNRSVRCPI